MSEPAEPTQPADRAKEQLPRAALARRELLSAAASTMLGLVTACGPSAGSTQVLQTPEGKVLQWEHENLLVLVSGLEDRYRPGQEIRLRVILNNQSQKLGIYRPRTKLAGRGQQVVVETAVESVQIKPFDAATLDRVLPLSQSLASGSYTLQVELPPWSLDGRQTGGGVLTAEVEVER
jgi:hypothetical protein